MNAPTATTTFRVLIDDADRQTLLAHEVARGLARRQKMLSPTWLYDATGSAIYEEITRLPEYYPFRAEQEILDRVADEIAARHPVSTVVELGSGSSEKTQRLLDALHTRGALRRFVPFDISESALRAAVDELVVRYPDVDVDAIVGDFGRHLGELPDSSPKLILFFGGTIGNLVPSARLALLRGLQSRMGPHDALLVGTDLVKDRARVIRAYDDASGVTARFNRNVLTMLNRELGASFDVDRFDHVAVYDDTHDWIEMRLRSHGAQRVRIAALGLTITFADGEDLRTEISAKFRRSGLESEFATIGFGCDGWWTDRAGDYAVSRWRVEPGR